MNISLMKVVGALAVGALACALAQAVFAGQTLKWEQVLKFRHPGGITNPYLPLATLKQDILEGTEDGKKTRVERTLMPEKPKTFQIGGQTVEALVMEDRACEDGKLAEVALDYFAQDDSGTVCYLGEDVDEYADGKTEYKYCAKGIGAVREVPPDGDELLISQNGISAKTGSPKPVK